MEYNTYLGNAITNMLYESNCSNPNKIIRVYNELFFYSNGIDSNLTEQAESMISNIPTSKGFQFSDYNGNKLFNLFSLGYENASNTGLTLGEIYMGQKDFPNTTIEKWATNIIPAMIGFPSFYAGHREIGWYLSKENIIKKYSEDK